MIQGGTVMSEMHLFAGGNTAQGFYSCFEDIMPQGQRRRMFYIKGGPGVGKSTLMGRVAKAAEEMGQRVEYFHCSSDPESLDGVALPDLGWALMDGTAPHVYDPAVPGARDTLLSLGDFLDEEAMRPKAKEIDALQQEISQRFRRCYRFLSAAGQLGKLCGAPYELRKDALHQLAQEWTADLPRRGGHGSCRRLFASAFTPNGLVDVLPTEGFTVCWVECPQTVCLTPLWQELSWTACWRGLPVIHLLNPLWPEELDGVLLPAQKLLFRTCPPQSRPEAVPLNSLMKGDGGTAGSDMEQNYDRNAYELMIQRALEQLACAKSLHDELESHYAGHMDFLGWQKKLDKVLCELRQALC